MKKYFLFISIIVAFNLKGFSQCTPDTSLTYGIYPPSDSIPCVQVGLPYQAILQIAFFDDSLLALPIGPISGFVIDSVKNLPLGLNYSAATTSDSLHWCVLIFGTTIASPGQYDLDIFISLNFALIGPISGEITALTNQLIPLIGIPYDTIEKPYLTVINPGAPCATIGGSFTNIISGTIFFDFNGNGLKDTTETVMANQIVTINPGPVSTYTNSAGEYFVFVDTGSYAVSMNAPQFFTVSTLPLVYNVNVTGPGQWLTGNDFGLAPQVAFDMVQVSITASAARPGFITTHWINYQNRGTTLLSGTITYQHDLVLQFLNSTVSATTQNANIITWNYSNLNPGEQRTIKVTFQIPPDNNLRGDTLVSTVSITPLSNVPHVNYNSDVVSQVVTGSYDPNDKQVTPDDLKNGLRPEEEIFYTIRFQNTGTDTAFTVVIRDTLDANLDVATFRTIAASHEVSFQLEGGRRAVWTFNNILLPDSGVNESGSHGFVKFSIFPNASVPHQTMINNSASIYFDFNDPVQTNTATVRIDLATGLSEMSASRQFSTVFPNPSSARFTIALKSALQNFDFQIFDIVGNVVQTIQHSGDRIEVALDTYPGGIYFYRIEKDSRILSNGKLVVAK